MKPAIYAVIALPIIISGCVLVAQEQANRAKKVLVGKTKAEILACAGVPTSTFTGGGVEYFAYSSAVTKTNNQCVMTLTFSGDRVSAVAYRTVSGVFTAPQEACGDMVSTCL